MAVQTRQWCPIFRVWISRVILVIEWMDLQQQCAVLMELYKCLLATVSANDVNHDMVLSIIWELFLLSPLHLQNQLYSWWHKHNYILGDTNLTIFLVIQKYLYSGWYRGSFLVSGGWRYGKYRREAESTQRGNQHLMVWYQFTNMGHGKISHFTQSLVLLPLSGYCPPAMMVLLQRPNRFDMEKND